MIIVNADDWGRSAAETDAALSCHRAGRITSVSAMVFMQDSVRAAALAAESTLGVGLHLNLTQRFDTAVADRAVAEAQARLCRFLGAHRYAYLLYNPLLRRDFALVCRAQLDEFVRLYGRSPTHVDGHHHRHLCTNLLLDPPFAAGLKLRRNFHFWPGEKSRINRAWRQLSDRWLARRYRVTDYFFALSQCLDSDRLDRVVALARTHDVELMTHPDNPAEQAFLMSEAWPQRLRSLRQATYSHL